MRTTVKAPTKDLVTEWAVGEPLTMQTRLEREKRKLAESPPAKLTARRPAKGKKALRKR
jgi:hypothetical protein